MVGMPGRGQLIVVASGKGGVGKTNLALNLGVRLARAGTRTILLDADFGHADADILLKISPRADVAGLRDPARPVDDLLTDGPEGLRVLCGVSALKGARGIREFDPLLYVRALRRLRAACDILLVDSGVGVRGAAASFALLCDLLVLVTTPEPTALTDCYATLKLLYQRGFCARAGVLVNMARGHDEALEAVRRLQRVAAQFLGLTLDNLGCIPCDRHVMAAVRQRVPFVTRYPRCMASACIDAVSQRLTSPVSSRRLPLGLWGRVASLFF